MKGLRWQTVMSILRGLDAIFDAHKAPEQAEPYLQKARTEAEHSHNDAGLLTVLNETMGFYRSQGRHTDNLPIIRESKRSVKSMACCC